MDSASFSCFSVSFSGKIFISFQAAISSCGSASSTSSVRNACNYLGICDSYLVEKLWQLGVSKAFFLPDAVELKEPGKESLERGGALWQGVLWVVYKKYNTIQK